MADPCTIGYGAGTFKVKCLVELCSIRFMAEPRTVRYVAERVGFEPTLPFLANTLSKRAPSATRPPLRDNRLTRERCSTLNSVVAGSVRS